MKTPIITLLCLLFITGCGFNTDTENSTDTQKPAKTPLSIKQSTIADKEALILNQDQPASQSQAIEQEAVNSADSADDQILQSPNYNKASTIYNAKKLRKNAESQALKPIISEEDDMPRLD